MNLTTPALLFPAISLLLLAFTNRFLALSSVIRNLHSRYEKDHDERTAGQIKILRKRVYLIRNMQALGISSLFSCVFCMFMIFFDLPHVAPIVFVLSLLLLMGSLAVSFYETQISVHALNIQLSDLQDVHVKRGEKHPSENRAVQS